MLSMYLIAAHMAGDYLFQSQEMATKKLTDRLIRLQHVTVYTACFVPVVILQELNHGVSSIKAFAFLVGLFLAHFLTDSKRWRTSNPWPAMPILQDQSLHAVQLAILGGLFLT